MPHTVGLDLHKNTTQPSVNIVGLYWL